MSNINLLPTKDKGAGHKKSDKNKDIIWSKPPKDKATEDKEKSSGWFSFFQKDSAKGEVSSKLKKDKFDKNNLKHSRKEVLKLIKEHESGKSNNEKQQPAGAKTKLSWWSKFKKPEDNADILFDYKQAIKKEKEHENTKTPARFNARQSGGQKHLTRQLVKAGKNKATGNTEKRDALKDAKKMLSDDRKQKARFDSARRAKSKSADAKTEKKEKKWENPDILETNLIKGEILFFFNWRKGIIKLLFTTVLSCLIIGIVYGGLSFWQKQKEEESEKIFQKFTELNYQIKQARQGIDEILVFQRKLDLISALLDKHVYWTNFFKFLEDNTLADVYFSNGFSGDTSGNYNFSAIGENYNTIHQQVKTLRDSEQVIKVEVAQGSFTPAAQDGQSRINFNLELSINPEIFYK